MKHLILLLLCLCFSFSKAQEETKNSFSISAGIAYGYRTAEVEDGINKNLKDHFEESKNGFSFFIQPRYSLNTQSALGLTYRRFSSTTQNDNLNDVLEGIRVTSLKEKIAIYFIGPTYFYHKNTPKNEFLYHASIGYIGYKNDIVLDRTFKSKLTGGNIGFDIGIEYLFNIVPKVFFGAQLSFTAGSLNKITTESAAGKVETDLGNDSSEGLNFLAFGPVVRVYL